MLPEASLKFIDWVSGYTLAPRGQILKMVLPLPEAFDPKRKKPAPIPFILPPSPERPPLTLDQMVAAEDIKKSLAHHTFSKRSFSKE